ncbi:MAG: hypothetical protein J7L86_05565 [Candidatus Marinimicrobia bacterium]|nr:hypothetical protein [Candidatus Neomarinimicrobiota bacterium]
MLLIVLGVIIVGVAIVVGINMFSQGAVNAEADRLVQEVNTVGSNAAAYWRKPVQMGGGGRSFTPLSTATNPYAMLGVQDTTANTILALSGISATGFTVTATGRSEGVTVEATINEDGVVGSPTITKP